jgi:ABC-type Fe3+-hydroxamate transport system substrate-binding protein
MAVFCDHLQRSITLKTVPRRIISVVPSQTELLFHLGLREEVVGITKFCVHPAEWFKSKNRVGGTKQLNMDAIRKLEPDLIIANKEENVRQQVEELAARFPVWVSDVNDLPSALDMIRQVGAITGRATLAHQIAKDVEHAFEHIPSPLQPLKAAYLIWREPWMLVGGDTFIHQMMLRAGFDNAFAHRARYPEVTIEEIRASGCEVVLLSSEPYPFRQKHVEELQKELPGKKVLLVDGEMFSWYGSRLKEAPAYFASLQIHAFSLF